MFVSIVDLNPNDFYKARCNNDVTDKVCDVVLIKTSNHFLLTPNVFQKHRCLFCQLWIHRGAEACPHKVILYISYQLFSFCFTMD